MTFFLALGLCIADPPKATPSVDDVRKALKENADRIKNRRILYVKVYRPGTPTPTFPPLEHPDRSETEHVIASDGRWMHRSTTLLADGTRRVSTNQSCDGEKTISLDALFQLQGSPQKPRVLISGKRPQWGIVQVEATTFRLGKPLHDSLGIRSSLTPTNDESGRVRLDPYVDDRAEFRTVYFLDPSKNWQPVETVTELPDGKGGWKLSGRNVVVEFMPGLPHYPKRITSWIPNGKELESTYYTIVSAEFPERFDDAEFQLPIPAGVRVRDDRTGREYYEGGGDVESPKARPAEHPFVHNLRHSTVEDWILYGGITLVSCLTIVAALFALGRLRKTTKDRKKRADPL